MERNFWFLEEILKAVQETLSQQEIILLSKKCVSHTGVYCPH